MSDSVFSRRQFLGFAGGLAAFAGLGLAGCGGRRPSHVIEGVQPQQGEDIYLERALETYREVTGEPAEPFSMGGGTYARNFERAVSFGPEGGDPALPDFGGPMHGPNECASEVSLKRALKIYILALLRLDALDHM